MSDIEALKKAVPPFQIFDLIPSTPSRDSSTPSGSTCSSGPGVPAAPQEDGFLMMRVRVPAAEFSSATMREVANIAEEYGRASWTSRTGRRSSSTG